MKNIIKFLILLLVSINISSCDAIDDLTEEEENMVLYIPVNIDPTDGVWATYSNSSQIDIEQWIGDEWFDKLESIKIIKVSYKITGFHGDEIGEVKAKLDINNVVTLNDEFIVNDAYINSTIFELKDIKTVINKNGLLTAKYSGSALCDEGGLHFTVEVTVRIQAKYKV